MSKLDSLEIDIKTLIQYSDEDISNLIENENKNKFSINKIKNKAHEL